MARQIIILSQFAYYMCFFLPPQILIRSRVASRASPFSLQNQNLVFSRLQESSEARPNCAQTPAVRSTILIKGKLPIFFKAIH